MKTTRDHSHVSYVYVLMIFFTHFQVVSEQHFSEQVEVVERREVYQSGKSGLCGVSLQVLPFR